MRQQSPVTQKKDSRAAKPWINDQTSNQATDQLKKNEQLST